MPLNGSMTKRFLALVIAAATAATAGAVHAQNLTVYSSGTVTVGTSRQLTAYVPLSPNTVAWSVNGVAGGNATIGTVSASGLYQAPAAIPAANVVSVRATSTAYPAKSDAVNLTITQPQVQLWSIYQKSVPAGPFTAVELVSSVAFLLVVCAASGTVIPNPIRWWRAGAIGLLEPGAVYLIMNIGLAHTSATHASLINALQPVLIVLIGWGALGHAVPARLWIPMALVLGGGHTLALGDASGKICGLVVAQRQRLAIGQGAELRQARAARQEAGVTRGGAPLGRSGIQLALHTQRRAAPVDPLAQPWPGADQRLVRHLDGWRARRRVVVERQQPRAVVGGQHRIDQRFRARVAGPWRHKRLQLGTPRPAAGIFNTLAQRDQAQKHLARSRLAIGVKRQKRIFGAARQRAKHPADCQVRVARQHAAAAPLEQLGKRVLQQRQRAGLLANIGHDRGGQLGIDQRTSALGRGADRAAQLVGRERQGHLGAGTHQRAEAGHEQRPVVEIGPQRDDHAQPALGAVYRVVERLQEARAHCLVGAERKGFFKLVDEQHQIGAVRAFEQLRHQAPQAIVALVQAITGYMNVLNFGFSEAITKQVGTLP